MQLTNDTGDRDVITSDASLTGTVQAPAITNQMLQAIVGKGLPPVYRRPVDVLAPENVEGTFSFVPDIALDGSEGDTCEIEFVRNLHSFHHSRWRPHQILYPVTIPKHLP